MGAAARTPPPPLDGRADRDRPTTARPRRTPARDRRRRPVGAPSPRLLQPATDHRTRGRAAPRYRSRGLARSGVPAPVPNPNTVQLEIRTAWWGGRSGWGQSRWRDRLTCHLVYLRLTTRGLARGRRSWEEPGDEFADGVAPEPGGGVGGLRGERRPLGRWSGARSAGRRRRTPGPGRARRGRRHRT